MVYFNSFYLRYHRQIPAILASLRTAGFSLFSMEITDQFGATPLIYYLTTITIPLVDEDDEMADETLFQIQAKHFSHVLQQAEKVLGPHELSTPVLEDACIIPFAAVRQFLESHIVDAKKHDPVLPSPIANKNSNNNNNNNVNTINNNNLPAPAPVRQQGRIAVSSSSNLGDLEL